MVPFFRSTRPCHLAMQRGGSKPEETAKFPSFSPPCFRLTNVVFHRAAWSGGPREVVHCSSRDDDANRGVRVVDHYPAACGSACRSPRTFAHRLARRFFRSGCSQTCTLPSRSASAPSSPRHAVLSRCPFSSGAGWRALRRAGTSHGPGPAARARHFAQFRPAKVRPQSAIHARFRSRNLLFFTPARCTCVASGFRSMTSRCGLLRAGAGYSLAWYSIGGQIDRVVMYAGNLSRDSRSSRRGAHRPGVNLAPSQAPSRSRRSRRS